MLIHKEFGWVFREQHESDHGIDALVETAVAGRPEGRLVALQIKSGASWFNEQRKGVGWIFRGPKRNFSYWLNYQLPVLVILFDPRTGRGYWAHVTPETVHSTLKGSSILVPDSHPLDSSTKSDIERIVKSWRYFPGEFEVDIPQGGSDLVDDVFAAAFTNSLRRHHAVDVKPLTRNSFVYAVKDAAEASGNAAERNASQGAEAWDLMIDRTCWLLKTEGSRRLSPGTVRIEKLLEARWIRDCTGPASYAMAVRAFLPEFAAHCDRMMVLRTSLEEERIRYDLIEPPLAVVLDKLLTLSQSDFSTAGRGRFYGVDIDDSDGSRICRVLFDSTVEKIRIWFSMAHCRPHGTWIVQF